MTTTLRNKVLLVENDTDMRTLLRVRLEDQGLVCTCANSGNDAAAIFCRESFDAVVSDLNMPDGDGVRLASWIRERSRIPLILISGYKDAYRRWLRDIPDVTFLHKPFEIVELVRLVHMTMQRPPIVKGTGASDADP